MIGSFQVCGIVTARGGSKGLPGKNIRPLLGKPLLAWTIEAAQQSQYLDRLILSSDDPDIIAVARAYGCEVPFVRPAELATDTATSLDAVRHALANTAKFDVVVILQPTSPLRLPEDIDAAIRDCVAMNRPCTLTVSLLPKPIEWAFRLSTAGTLLPIVSDGQEDKRRQDLSPSYAINGAVYAARASWAQNSKSFLTKQTGAIVMPKERSVDIDDEIDFKIAETMARYLRERA